MAAQQELRFLNGTERPSEQKVNYPSPKGSGFSAKLFYKKGAIKMLNEKQDKNKSTDSNTTTLLENCDLVEAPPEEIQDAGDF